MSVINIKRHQIKLFVWLTLLLTVLSLPAGAQNYFFDNYGINQGLSAQKVYTLLQDSKDYIWLGTSNGLSRFDGKKFEDFTSHNSLAPDGVRCMIEDSLGYIWFGHLNGGISRFNGRIFERITFDSLNLNGDITSIAQINDKIWFTSYGEGVIQADFPIADIKHIKAKQFIGGKDNLSDRVVGSSINQDGSFICLAEFPTIVASKRYNKEEKRFENYRMPNMTTDFSTSCLLEDNKGNRWFGTYYGGLYKYIMSESRMVYYDLVRKGVPSNVVSCLTEDSRGRVWVGTWGGGVAVFDGDEISMFNESNGLKATRIYDIIEDVENNILIADETNGLTIFKGDAFVTFNEKGMLPDPNVNAIFQDKSAAIWLGTNKGITQFFPGSEKKSAFFNDPVNMNLEEIRALKEDRNGNLWIGATSSTRGGVILYNTTTSEFEHQPEINSVISMSGQLKTMEIDKQNNLWIGTIDGVFIGAVNKHNFIRKNQLDSLEVHAITTLYCDPKGGMWIGTVKNGDKPSLFKFTAPGKDISAVSNIDFKMVSALSGVEPTALVMDSKGILWVGTNEGLFAFRNDSVISTLTQNDGLLSNLINLLAVGRDGSIYIGTNSGLNRYFPDSNRIFSFTERNGFPGILTRSNAVYESPAGDLWFGTANGATRLIPEKLLTKELEPLTHISSMRVNNKPEPREMIPGMKLKYSEGSILFDYYSICLTNPDVVRYKVRLEGADKDWQPLTDQPRANYPALAPGKYTFMVIACNSQGVWNSKPASFSFTIKPPFYLSWWFILISLCAIIISVKTYIRIREQNLVRENEKLEVKVKERTAEVVQKSEIIEEKNRDITASIRYAERIQRALLPREEHFHFVDMFVLYMPKDIVSGDFYWMYDNGESLFIAAVDCTGHGVPGAFMSIIGHNSLNKVVKELGFTKPSTILDHLNAEVTMAIMQSHEKGINDGMDLTLISYNKKTKAVELAGAFNPLFKVRTGEVIVHKTDRFAIGMRTIEQKKNFTNFEIDIRSGDMLYLFSDGYADQFGSVDGKKFKTVNIKRILSEIWNMPVLEQKARLEKEILEWKGELSQVDDIMIIGMRIPD